MKKDILDPIVKRLIKSNIRPMIDLTVRGVQASVLNETGAEPSTSEVLRSMIRNGAFSKGHRWVWKGKPSHGD
jgi:hypothetical protein